MKSPLPTYSIYGEHGRTMDVDWLHCESIAERSGLQDWEIRPHRHELLFQLCWIEQGSCELSMDGADSTLTGPGVLLLPPLVMHGFRFSPGVQGQVITVLAQHLRKLLAAEPLLEKRLWLPRAQALEAADAASVAAAMQALREEFTRPADWRSLGVDSGLARLLVTLGRCLSPAGIAPAANSKNGARAQQHVQRYRALIEERFRAQPVMSALAAEIGITTTQLNRVCHSVLGCASVAVLHARLLLEAQRELAYTTMSIKQIAHDLGFADAAYFSRFYQRKTGLSPTQWRSASAGGKPAGRADS